jgi:nitrogen fixation-related uncharacterized protein
MKSFEGQRVTEHYQQPMTVEESAMLKSQIKTSLYLLIIVSICLCACIVFYVSPFSFTQILLLILAVVCTYWVLTSKSYENPPIRQDLEAGIKLVVQGKIEAKREDSSDQKCFLTLLGHEFEVSLEQWQQVKINQPTEIHFAPRSKCILQLRPLANPTNT